MKKSINKMVYWYANQKMWRVPLLVVLVNVAIVSARDSANGADIRKLFNQYSARYSDNIFEDAELDVPSLIAKYRYPVEVHTVTTPDGYILEMHRIPHGRDRNNEANVTRPAVLLMHGLLLSSADWIVMGPGSALGYILAEEGYDVWMGNARGTYYSRKHLYLNPDSIFNKSFWKFTWEEIGRIDCPTMIDYMLETTGQEKLHYVGHSQGTTTFFVMGIMRPEYNDKIISMQALAPVAYLAQNKDPLVVTVAPLTKEAEPIIKLLGLGELLPNTVINQWAGQALCNDQAITQVLCSSILFLIAGWDGTQLNTTTLPIIFGHAPAGVSVRQVAHFGQQYQSKQFQRYDYGTLLGNWKAYGSFCPPKYDLSKVTAPVFLHYSDNDSLAAVGDVETLFSELGRPMGKFRVPYALFNHIDHIYGIDAKELVYDRVISLMKAMDVSNSR